MRRNAILRAVVCLAMGVVLLITCAVVDTRDASDTVRDGFAFVGPVPDWPGVKPFVVVEADGASEGFLSLTPQVVFAEFDDSEWASLLDEGRLPEPGAREALAGALCQDDVFTVGGESYTVTGRIRRSVPSMSTVYAVPHSGSGADSLLDEHAGRRGFYDWEARSRVAEDGFELPDDVEPLIVHEAVPMVVGLPFVQLFGLGLALYGAAVLQWGIVVRLHARIGAFDGLVGAQRNHVWLFRSVLLLNYATFLFVMFIGILAPRQNLAASQYVMEVFTEGDLKELGDAYFEGNIPRAAWETFRNNFIVQTVVLSTIPSIFVPFFGVGKTLLSLVVVGFAMAPVWSGSAAPMTFHWVTIALELQAYILVSFGICAYTVDVARAIRQHFRSIVDESESTFWRDFVAAFEQLASATMYACAALAIAAIFEAVTLIGFGSSVAS